MSALVGIIMGSESDQEVMKEAALILEFFGIPHEINIVSAHRTPDRMRQYAQEAKNKGLKVIIIVKGSMKLSNCAARTKKMRPRARKKAK